MAPHHSSLLCIVNSILLQQERSKTLSNGGMRSINEVRRLRLKMLKEEQGSWAEINEKLGRLRGDSTLNQLANAAPNSKTGKPRNLGDELAELLEETFAKPRYWFDLDPDFERCLDELRAAHHIAEPRATYRVNWPFQRVQRERYDRLPAAEKLRIEAYIEGSVAAWESMNADKSNGTNGG